MIPEEMFTGLVSAGGVVYRCCGKSLQVVVCSRQVPFSNNLPKGTPDPGET